VRSQVAQLANWDLETRTIEKRVRYRAVAVGQMALMEV